MKLTQTTGPTLGGQKPKEKKNQPLSLGKGDFNHSKFKKKIMKRWKNTTQMKEQSWNTEVQISEEEIAKLPEKEFGIFKNPENKMEKIQESINKDIEELKNKHTKTNNTITEIKNTVEGINSRISEAEEWITGLEDKMVEITS